MHRIVGKQIGHRRWSLRHWAVGAVVLVGVGAAPAGAVTNQEPSDLADAIEAAKSVVMERRPQAPGPAIEPRRSCGWWTLEGQETIGGAQHALLCTPPAATRELDGA